MRRRLIFRVASSLVAGVILAPMLVYAIFAALVDPREANAQIDRSRANAEAVALDRYPWLLRIIAAGPSSAEDDVWLWLAENWASGQHRIAVNPTAAWSDRQDATELWDRITHGSPNDEAQPDAGPAVHQFLVRAAQPATLPIERFSNRLVPLTEQDFADVIARRDDWQQLASRLDGVRGYVSFSRVGFAEGGKLAVVYVEFSCGSLCGYGSYLILRKSAEGWERVAERVSWVA